jgi:hypothetical protein
MTYLSVDGGEADVVLLNDAGVQAVEIEQQDVGVVEAPLGVQHETALVGRLPLALHELACVCDIARGEWIAKRKKVEVGW